MARGTPHLNGELGTDGGERGCGGHVAAHQLQQCLGERCGGRRRRTRVNQGERVAQSVL